MQTQPCQVHSKCWGPKLTAKKKKQFNKSLVCTYRSFVNTQIIKNKFQLSKQLYLHIWKCVGSETNITLRGPAGSCQRALGGSSDLTLGPAVLVSSGNFCEDGVKEVAAHVRKCSPWGSAADLQSARRTAHTADRAQDCSPPRVPRIRIRIIIIIIIIIHLNHSPSWLKRKYSRKWATFPAPSSAGRCPWRTAPDDSWRLWTSWRSGNGPQRDARQDKTTFTINRLQQET